MEHLKFGPSGIYPGKEEMTEVIICLMLIVVLVYLLRKR